MAETSALPTDTPKPKPPCPFCGAVWCRNERGTYRTMRHADDCEVVRAIQRGDDVWYDLAGLPEIVTAKEAARRRERVMAELRAGGVS